MPSEIIAIGIAFIFVAGFALGAISALAFAIKYPRNFFTCVHGHSDWDDCPICRR